MGVKKKAAKKKAAKKAKGAGWSQKTIERVREIKKTRPKKRQIIKRAKPKGPGPPPYKPTDENRAMVEGMVAAGLKRTQVASIMEISPSTLREHFPLELKNGDAKAIFNVASGLYKNATTGTSTCPGGNVTAQIFFLKTRARWRETSRHEVTGPDGEPIAHAHEIKDLENLSAKELAKLYAEATGSAPGG